MSVEVQDKVSVSLFVDGEELLFGRANTLHSLQVSESVDLSVPMLQVSLSDQYEQISSEGMMADGALIRVVLHPRTDATKTKLDCTFRLNSVNRTTEGGITRVNLDAYLDVPLYWHAASSREFKGTSSACLSSLASECGMDFDVDATSDAQTWYPAQTVNHLWARHVAQHGFKSSSSCMQLAVTSGKRLLYKDLNMARPPKDRMSYVEVRPEYILVTDAAPSIRSGTSNHVGGYYYGRVRQSVKSGVEVLDQVNAPKGRGDKSLMVNKKLHSKVELGRTKFSAIDVGNTHDSYEVAFHQNLRLRSLYAASTAVLTPECTDLQLLDWVQFAVDSNYGSMAAFSGMYQVMSKASILRGTDYVERFELGRRSLPVALKDAL